MIELITPKTAAETSASFTTTGPFVLYGEGFEVNEYALLEQEIRAGIYRKCSNVLGYIGVTKFPNSAYFDAKGTFKVTKRITAAAAGVSYEEQ